MYVVDASIAVKWFLNEDGSPRARALRQQHLSGDVELAAPDLLVYEIANVLVCKRTFGADEVTAAIDSILTMEMTLYQPDVAWAGHAGRLATDLRTSFYDATYVALAQWLHWELLTADRKLTKAARGQVTIRSLDDLP